MNLAHYQRFIRLLDLAKRKDIRFTKVQAFNLIASIAAQCPGTTQIISVDGDHKIIFDLSKAAAKPERVHHG